MRLIRTSVVVLASVLAASSATAQTSAVSIQFQNGNVTVRTAARTPLRTVLQEWARVGKARIVNAETVSVTLDQLELVNVPEQQALAILLRDISGYAVGAREVASTGPSQFDRIMLLPRSVGNTSPGPRPTSVVSTAPPPPPIAFIAGDPDDDPNAAARRLPAAQQGLTNAAVAAARDAAAAGAQNSDRNPSEDGQRPGPATSTPANPFFSGPSGRPGQIAPAPPQQRNPLRPNGDPEP
jgi:hypothetical protein